MRSLFFYKAFYFFFYAAGASLIPFLAVYYQSIGFNGSQIGILAGVSPFVMLISAPMWSGAADVHQRHKTILFVAIIGALVSAGILSTVNHFFSVFVVVLSYAFFASPIIPLIDNSVMTILENDRTNYGKQRLWGAIGWGIAGPAVGYLADQIGLSVPFYGYLVMMGMCFITALKLPIISPKKPASMWKGVKTLLIKRQWLIFLSAVYISGTSLAIITNFLFLYFVEIGASRSMMGFALTVATVSEVPVLFYSGKLLKRWGAQTVLIVSLIAAILRSLGYAFFPFPWFALGLQLLHGVTFSGMWAAGVSYANENAPAGLGATAQSLFFSVVFGISSITGAVLGGFLFQAVGGIAMFRWSGLVVLLTTVVYLVYIRLQRSGN
jgi:MFS transporter, PPP family, 3-phenylpropionic acid transporter